MHSKKTEIASEVQEKAKEIAGEAEEAVDWVIQTIVLALCGGFLMVMLAYFSSCWQS